MSDTIAAIATAMSPGGIGIIRISGEQARDVAEKVFQSKNEKKISSSKGYTALYGKVYDADGDIDEAIALVFLSPKSYTGEDVVELSCHGGMYNLQRLLRQVIKCGARVAEAGEFTRRAFLNGRISLTQAEAVMDIISAQGEQALRAALAARSGRLAERIYAIREKLINICAHLSAWADYPEEDIIPVDKNLLLEELNCLGEEVSYLISTYDRGRLIRDGIDTVIIGKPNVGKSTLMNLLSGHTRSIVTDVPGTTRDIVEEMVRLDGITLRLADTAGLRDTEDIIENIGVNMARERLESAELILAVFDSSVPLDREDSELLKKLENRNVIIILNKNDLKNEIDIALLQKFPNIVEISALEADSFTILKESVENIFGLLHLDTASGILANERQRDSAVHALECINEAAHALKIGMTLDAVTVSLESAVSALLELTGENASEAVVDRVFAQFCVGK